MKIKRTLFPLTMTALGTALIAVCAFITLTFGDLKFTLQLFAVLLISGLFPPVYAFASILAYPLLGALGVPVFAGFQGGIGALFGPTGGFLLGFLPSFLLISLPLKALKKPKFYHILLLFVGEVLVCYLAGTIGLYIYMPDKGLSYILLSAVIPYILPDCAKVILSAILVTRLRPMIYPKFTLSRKAEEKSPLL